jgi:hypothetical protein
MDWEPVDIIIPIVGTFCLIMAMLAGIAVLVQP